MIFNGLEVTALGNAKLSITPRNTLRIENIGSTGFDGLLINTKDMKNPHVYFTEVPDVRKGSYKISSMAMGNDNVAYTFQEKVFWYDQASKSVLICYNSNLLSKKFTVIGKLNGNVVYSEEFDNPNSEDGSGQPLANVAAWVQVGIALVAIAIDVYLNKNDTVNEPPKKISHYKACHEEYYKNGKLKSRTWVDMTDPEPINVKIMGKEMLLDEFGCQSVFNYGEAQEVPASNINSIMITGYNTDYFEITSIE